MQESSRVIFESSRQNNFFRKRHTSTLSFAAGILLFLLPFAELKCGGMTLARNTGIGIATGQSWKTATGTSYADYLESLNPSSTSTTKEKLNEGPNVFAILALVFALAGIAVYLSAHRVRAMAGMSAGILAAIMLIALLVQYKLAMRSALSGREGTDNINFGAVLKLNFTAWYFLSLIAFAAAAFFSYKHSRIELEDALDRKLDFEFQHTQNSISPANQDQ